MSKHFSEFVRRHVCSPVGIHDTTSVGQLLYSCLFFSINHFCTVFCQIQSCIIEGVFSCQDCHNKIPHTRQFKPQEFIFLQFQGPEVKMDVTENLVCREACLPGSQRNSLSCLHMTLSLCMRAEGSNFMTSFNLSYLLKGSISKYRHLWSQGSNMNLGETQLNPQQKADAFLLLLFFLFFSLMNSLHLAQSLTLRKHRILVRKIKVYLLKLYQQVFSVKYNPIEVGSSDQRKQLKQ